MYAFLRWVMRVVVRVYLVGGLFRLEGLENVPLSGAVLICPNHRSTIDPPLVPAFMPRGDTWNMAKSEYFARPGFKAWLFRSYQAFPVVRHTADRKAIRRAFEILAAGEALVIYPEGTRVESGGLKAAEPGAGFIAQRAEVPVLPVALTGTRECFPKGAHWPRRVPVRMRIGKPFRIPRKDAQGRKISAQEASDIIMRAIAEMLPEEMRGVFAGGADAPTRA